jgi:hypothetical protein
MSNPSPIAAYPMVEQVLETTFMTVTYGKYLVGFVAGKQKLKSLEGFLLHKRRKLIVLSISLAFSFLIGVCL